MGLRKIKKENNESTTMAIIHCGFVLNQNILTLTRLISTRNVSFGKFHNEIIA
jgi:hypothetical protein